MLRCYCANKRKKIEDVCVGKLENAHVQPRIHLQVYHSSGAAGDGRGEHQGHCMRRKAVMSALVKWLLSSADR